MHFRSLLPSIWEGREGACNYVGYWYGEWFPARPFTVYATRDSVCFVFGPFIRIRIFVRLKYTNNGHANTNISTFVRCIRSRTEYVRGSYAVYSYVCSIPISYTSYHIHYPVHAVALSTVYDTKMSNEYYWVIESASMTAWQLASADSRQKS